MRKQFYWGYYVRVSNHLEKMRRHYVVFITTRKSVNIHYMEQFTQ